MTTIRSASKPLVSLANKEPTLVGESSLFRPEVVSEQQTKWLGTVLLTPSISHSIFAIFAGLVILSLLALLFFGDYTRKARINGWLVPEMGLVRVFAPQSGSVTQLHVQEGAEVKKGDPLHAAFDRTRKRGARRHTAGNRPSADDRRDSMDSGEGTPGAALRYQTEELSDRLATIEARAGAPEGRSWTLQRDRAGRSPKRPSAGSETLRERGLATRASPAGSGGGQARPGLAAASLERSRWPRSASACRLKPNFAGFRSSRRPNSPRSNAASRLSDRSSRRPRRGARSSSPRRRPAWSRRSRATRGGTHQHHRAAAQHRPGGLEARGGALQPEPRDRLRAAGPAGAAPLPGLSLPEVRHLRGHGRQHLAVGHQPRRALRRSSPA